MPLIQPTMQVIQPRAIPKTDMNSDNRALIAATSATIQPATDAEIGVKAIAPAAPPTAVQMQIKAIITEQAQSLSQNDTNMRENMS